MGFIVVYPGSYPAVVTLLESEVHKVLSLYFTLPKWILVNVASERQPTGGIVTL